MKADLHYHGPIGFQPYWLKAQGYEGKNLLEEIADACLARDIDIAAITSEEKEIPRGTVHDRLNWLARHTSSLSREYKAERLGTNILIVERGKRKVYLINSQTVLMKDKGRDFEHLVVGSNEVPNSRTIGDSLAYGKDKGLIQIAEHPLCEAHHGIGADNLERYFNLYDAIEGHNSQLIFKAPLSLLPVFKNFKRDLNNQAQQFAVTHHKPWTAVSDGHRIEDAGLSYIEFDQELLRTDSEKGFIASLKNTIDENHFASVCKYPSLKEWRDWVGKFMIGVKFHASEI